MKNLIIALAVAVTANTAIAADCMITTSEGKSGEYTKTLKTLKVNAGESVMAVVSQDLTSVTVLDFENISFEELLKYNGQKVVAFYQSDEDGISNSIVLATINSPSMDKPDQDWFVNKIFAAGSWESVMFLADENAKLAAVCQDNMYQDQ